MSVLIIRDLFYPKGEKKSLNLGVNIMKNLLAVLTLSFCLMPNLWAANIASGTYHSVSGTATTTIKIQHMPGSDCGFQDDTEEYMMMGSGYAGKVPFIGTLKIDCGLDKGALMGIAQLETVRGKNRVSYLVTLKKNAKGKILTFVGMDYSRGRDIIFQVH